MKKIYYLQKIEIELGDLIAYKGFKTTVTEELIELNPELFLVKDPMQELLDKAKRDYPVGTVFRSKYGIQKVLNGKPYEGLFRKDTVQIDTDKFPEGGNLYTPEDGWSEIIHLKFTTEDGVDIYGDMKTYLVHPKDNWSREELITTVIDLFLKEREYREKHSHFIDREDLNE